MNLREDRREGGSVLCPQLLPVLVLVKVWSEGSEPCGDTELVFLLLEAVCALEGSVEVKLSLYVCLSSLSVHSCLVCVAGYDTAVRSG